MNDVACCSRTILPTFAKDVLDKASKFMLPDPRLKSLSPTVDISSIACRVLDKMTDTTLSYTVSLEAAAAILAEIPCEDDRISVIEHLGKHPLGPLFFVDDGSAPYATTRDVAAVSKTALTKYEHIVKAMFNREKNKNRGSPHDGRTRP